MGTIEGVDGKRAWFHCDVSNISSIQALANSIRIDQYRYQLDKWGVRKADSQIVLPSGSEAPSFKSTTSANIQSSASDRSSVISSRTLSTGSMEPSKAEHYDFIELLLQSDNVPLMETLRFWSNLETTADFLLSVGCLSDALPLYRMLCQHIRGMDLLPLRLFPMVSNCVFSAFGHLQFGHDQVLRDMEQLLENMWCFWHLDYSAWLCTEQLNSLPPAFDFLNKLSDPFKVLGSVPRIDRCWDFLLYAYGIHVLNESFDQSIQNDSTGFDLFMAKMDPGPFAIKDECMQNQSLSTYLHWCQKRIKNVFDGGYPISLGALETLSALFSEYDPKFALFCYLWDLWQTDNSSVSSTDVEERMGLKVPELLKTICIMITRNVLAWRDTHSMDYGSQLDDIERMDLAYDDLLEYMRAVSHVCDVFLEGDGLTLCMSFLAAFRSIRIQEDEWQDHSFGEVPIEVRRKYAASLIKRHLTTPSSSALYRRSVTSAAGIEAELSRTSTRPIFGPQFGITDIVIKASNPTIAKSIGSSSRTWESVKKTAQRARDLTGPSACPPVFELSAMDEDMKTLSDELDTFSISENGETEHQYQLTNA